MIISIENLEPVVNKQGEAVEGESAKGTHWALWKVNGKYSYFHFGEGSPELEMGKEYDFDVEKKVNGKYTNYTIKLKTENRKEEKSEESSKVLEKVAEVGEVVKNIEELVIGMGAVLEDIKKSTEGGKADEDI